MRWRPCDKNIVQGAQVIQYHHPRHFIIKPGFEPFKKFPVLFHVKLTVLEVRVDAMRGIILGINHYSLLLDKVVLIVFTAMMM